MKKFQIGLIIRVLILTASVFLLAYIYFNNHLAATELIISALIILQLYLLMEVGGDYYDFSNNSPQYDDMTLIAVKRQ